MARRQPQNLRPQALQPLAQFKAHRRARGRVRRQSRNLFLAAGLRRNPGRLLDAHDLGGQGGETRKIDGPRQRTQDFKYQRRQRMGGNRPSPQPVEAAFDIRGVHQPLGGGGALAGARRGSARQPANGGSVGASPQAETAAGFDHIAKPLAQAVVLREALREETIDRVGRDPGGKRVERKIAGRATLAESPQPAEQFQHGFARELGRVLGSIEGTQPFADHAIQDGRGAIGEQGFEDAVGVVTGRRAGEITLEKFLAPHNVRRLRTIIIIDPMRIAILLIATLVASAVFCPCADGDLASALLAARNADERTALIRGHDVRELAAALEGIEKTAAASYDGKDYPAALNAYQAALALGRELGNAAKLPFYFRRIGICLGLLGQSDAAVAVYREGVAASEKTNDSAMLLENLHGLAVNLQRIGRYREALPLCEKEVALAEASGQPEPMIHALTTYQETLTKLGRLREALPLAERAFELSRHSAQPIDYSNTLANLAMLYIALGDYETSLRVLRSLPNPNADRSELHRHLPERRLHREADAESSYRAALAASTGPGDWRIHATTLSNLGILQCEWGKLAEARANIEQALAVFLSHRDRGEAAASMTQLSEIAAERKEARGGSGEGGRGAPHGARIGGSQQDHRRAGSAGGGL